MSPSTVKENSLVQHVSHFYNWIDKEKLCQYHRECRDGRIKEIFLYLGGTEIEYSQELLRKCFQGHRTDPFDRPRASRKLLDLCSEKHPEPEKSQDTPIIWSDILEFLNDHFPNKTPEVPEVPTILIPTLEFPEENQLEELVQKQTLSPYTCACVSNRVRQIFQVPTGKPHLAAILPYLTAFFELDNFNLTLETRDTLQEFLSYYNCPHSEGRTTVIKHGGRRELDLPSEHYRCHGNNDG